MASSNKTTLNLNLWEASDKPSREDFVSDNIIIDEKLSQAEQALTPQWIHYEKNSENCSEGGIVAYKMGHLLMLCGALTVSKAGHNLELAQLHNVQLLTDAAWTVAGGYGLPGADIYMNNKGSGIVINAYVVTPGVYKFNLTVAVA